MPLSLRMLISSASDSVSLCSTLPFYKWQSQRADDWTAIHIALQQCSVYLETRASQLKELLRFISPDHGVGPDGERMEQ